LIPYFKDTGLIIWWS